MRYDTMEVREQDYSFPRDPTMTVRDPDSPDTRQRRAIQKALTTAKKQDGKVRKIKEMLAYRQQQWEVFSKKMKTNFLKQERQFHEDMDKLNAELTQAQAQGKEAAALMQRLASGQTDMEEDEPVLPDTAWETLLNASAPDPDSYLEEALRAAGRYALQLPERHQKQRRRCILRARPTEEPSRRRRRPLLPSMRRSLLLVSRIKPRLLDMYEGWLRRQACTRVP